MKAQSLRGRRTFEMRASSCEEHIQRRVLPQPRRPYVLRRLGSAQKVYHRVRLGQPGGGGGGAAPVAAGARDAARLARAGGAAVAVAMEVSVNFAGLPASLMAGGYQFAV